MRTGPKGAPLPGRYRVALLEKGLPFPAKCALSWPGSGALRVTELTKQPTRARQPGISVELCPQLPRKGAVCHRFLFRNKRRCRFQHHRVNRRTFDLCNEPDVARVHKREQCTSIRYCIAVDDRSSRFESASAANAALTRRFAKIENNPAIAGFVLSPSGRLHAFEFSPHSRDSCPGDTMIYKRTKNLRAFQLLLGNTKLERPPNTSKSRSMMP